MPYKDVYGLGVEFRNHAAEYALKFEFLCESCEYQIKPVPIKSGPYAGAKMMRHCKLLGNAVKLECCKGNCPALRE